MATFPASHVSTFVSNRFSQNRLFKSSAGRFFHFAVDEDAATDVLSVARATDPTGTWTQITTNAPDAGSTEPIFGVAGYQDGDIIHVAFMGFSGTNTEQRTHYAQFDMSASSGDGAWVDLGASDYEIEIDVSDSNTGDQGFFESARSVDIVKRANGDLILAYQDNRHRDMGKNFAHVVFQYSTDNGVTWNGSPIALSPASGSNHWLGPRLMVTPAGRVYCFYGYFTGGTLKCSLLRATDLSVSTSAPDNLDIDIDATITTVFAYPVGFGSTWRDSSGTVQVGVAYADDPDDQGSIASVPGEADDLGSATVTITANWTTNAVVGNTGLPDSLGLITDGFDKYLVFSDVIDDDMKYNLNDTGDVVIIAGVGGDRSDTYAIYDNDGPKLGVVYRVFTTGLDYIEVDIAKTTGSLADVLLPDQNFFVGPFET